MSSSPVGSPSSALGEALEQYLQHLAHFRQCSPLTVEAYRSDARNLLIWLQGRGRAQDTCALTQPTLLQYLGEQQGLSANTIRRRLHALRGWCGFMVRQGLLEADPTAGLPLPKRKRATPHYPSADQVEALLRAARTPLERAAIWLLAGTGLRRAELLSLDLTDLAPDLSELRVVGKGNKERRVPIPTSVREVLQGYLDGRGDRPGPLLLNGAGKRAGSTTLRRLFTRLVRRANLQECGFSLHSMRHAYATMLVKSGVDLGTIRDLLGHSDIAVTSVYLHSDLRSRRDAVELLPLAQAGGGANG